jgi:hypothetical protein
MALLGKRGWNGVRIWQMLLVVGLAALAAPMFGQGPSSGQGQPYSRPAAAQQQAGTHPLDQPLQWMREASKVHAGLKDYMCTLVKQERIKGRLQEQNIIIMKFRNRPFSVNMRWLAPRESANQEVSFIYGRNGNKMRVNFSKGLKKLAGFVSVDPNDPRVLQHSRHTIYEAGMGSLIEQTIRNWEMEKKINKIQVRLAEYSFNNRRCYRVECTHTERHPQAYSYRSVLYLDKEWKLPIRAENYDWPYEGSPAGGDLLEVFSFVDLRFNLDLTDADFVR